MKKNKNNKKKDNFIEFLKKSKGVILLITFFLLLTYGGRLANNSFSIDTELYMRSASENYQWWISLDRWGLVIFNKIFLMSDLLIYQTHFLTTCLILIYSLLINYLIYIHIDEKYEESFKKLQFIFPIVMLTSPIFAEMYNFAILNTAIAVGICMITISLILTEKYSESEDKKIKWTSIITHILLTTFAFGIYQAIVPLYIFLVAACYGLKCFKEKNMSLKWLIKQIIIFGISALIYLIICKSLPSNSYFNSGWSDYGLGCIFIIWHELIRILKCESLFYTYTYIVAIILVVIVNLKLLLDKKNNLGIILSSLAVAFAPIMIIAITGIEQLKRTQFNYPFCIAFIYLIFAMIIYNKNYKKFLTIFILFILYVSYTQAMISGNLFYSDEVRYQNDVLIGRRIESMIEDKEWYDKNKEYKLIVFGEINNNANNSYLKGEVMGRSFFEFDSKSYYGTSDRVPAFMSTLGYNYKVSTRDEYESAKKYLLKNEVKSYPNKDCVINKDNIIIIKLSDEIE